MKKIGESEEKEEYRIHIIRTNRRTISLSLDENLDILVRAPYFASDYDVMRLVREKSNWIKKHRSELLCRQEQRAPVERLTPEQLHKLAEEALEYIPKRVEFFARQLPVQYGRITIRNQRTRWGSCSQKGNLNFNCLLMLTPPEVIDYVVVHELCHRIEMNHSKRFWEQVERILPDYRRQREWLKENGHSLMRRMTG